MGKTDRITERQLKVLLFVSILSPMVRILPTSAVVFGGRAAWLSPVAAYILGKLLLAFMDAMEKNAPEGVGLADMAQLGLGAGAGRAFNVLVALWLTFYAGFVCRSAAERLVSTVYPNGNAGVFIVAMLAVAVVTASGLTKSLARTAEVLMPVLVAVIAAVLLSALPDVEGANLLPVTYRDAKRVIFGALPIFNVMTVFVYFLFLAGKVQKKPSVRPNRFPWLLMIAVVALGVTFARVWAPAYVAYVFIEVFSGAARGVGVTFSPWAPSGRIFPSAWRTPFSWSFATSRSLASWSGWRQWWWPSGS